MARFGKNIPNMLGAMNLLTHLPLFFLFFIAVTSISLQLSAADPEKDTEMQQIRPPKFLYKIISLENWETSQAQSTVQLAPDDADFVHLAREDQLGGILGKYWNSVPEYVLLKLDTSKLHGRWAYEANPGGTAKYYHLYGGSIPFEAIAESKVIKQK